MSNWFVKHKVVISALLMTTVLSACGFKLRGDYLLADELQKLNVNAIDKHGELTRIVKKHLTNNQVTVLKRYDGEKPELYLLNDTLDRRMLSMFPNGQVAEYEVIYTVRYQLRIPNKDALSFTFELNRDYQDDPSIALAKSRELNLMLKEMRIEAADRILRNMASITP